MTKRRNKRGSALDNLFGGGVNPYGDSAENSQTIATQTGDLLHLNIMSVMPDPGQPRDLLPANLYAALFSGAANPIQVLDEWVKLAQSGNSAEKQTLADLEQLAQTIKTHGLISPITVRPVFDDEVPATVSYLIRTGERRWWAHVWLTARQAKIKKSQSPEQVRAILETDVSQLRAEQLVENMARSDLSVIEKAKGIAALRQEMSAERGELVNWEVVEQLLGISRNYRWRLGKVLDLPEAVVELVTTYNLPERSLRPVVDKLSKQPDLQLEAVEQLVAWQEAEEDTSYKRVLDYVQLLQRRTTTKPAAKDQDGLGGWSAKFGRNLNKTLKLFDELDDEQLAGYAAMVANDRASAEKLNKLNERLKKLLQASDQLA